MKTLILTLAFLVPASSFGGVAPFEKQQVQKAMKAYTQKVMADGKFFPVVYGGKVLNLKLATSPKYPDGFHSGVVKSGNLYASCADFVDPKTGNKFDIDFLAKKVGENFIITQPIIHSVNGKKTPYHLDH